AQLSTFFSTRQSNFTGKYKHHTYETLEKDHGRIEKRIYTALQATEVFNESEYIQWQGLRSLIQVERMVSNPEGESPAEKQYYISSLAPEYCE
ncbi:hypothetical protein HMPREF1554_00186, partial [Porphyromonas gingivalis F0569]